MHPTGGKWFAILSIGCLIGFLFSPILGFMALRIKNANMLEKKYKTRFQVSNRDHIAKEFIFLEVSEKLYGRVVLNCNTSIDLFQNFTGNFT